MALVTRAFWQRHLGSDPRAIGRVLSLGGEPVQVVGLLQPLQGPLADPFGNLGLLRPLRPDPALGEVNLLLRLSPGWSEARVTRELPRLGAALRGLDPSLVTGTRLRFQRHVTRLDSREMILLLGLGLPCFVVACAAVAALLLALGADRLEQTALRSALGASRRRLLLEGLAPALALGLGAALLAWSPALALVRALPLFFDPGATLLDSPLGPGTFLGVLGAGLAAALGAGFWPAWQASGPNPAQVLGRGAGLTPRSGRLQRWLVSGQIAVALALVACSALFWQHQARQSACAPVPAWRGLLAIRPVGMHYSGISMSVMSCAGDLNPALLPRLRALLLAQPGVREVTEGDPTLFPTFGLQRDRLRAQGQPLWTPCTRQTGGRDWAGIRGLALLGGRLSETPGEVLLGHSLAQRLFPGETALGRWVEVPVPGAAPRTLQVVGVLQDLFSPQRPDLPVDLLLVHTQGRGGMVVRLDDASPRAVEVLQQHLRAAFPDQDLAITSGLDTLSEATALARTLTWMLGTLGLGSLLLALAGVSGLQVFLVQRRRREFGVRAALGADRRRLLSQVALESLRLALWGLPLGGLGALLLGLLASARIPGLQPLHAPSLALLAGLFPLTILAASLPAALRASRCNPAEVMRSE